METPSALHSSFFFFFFKGIALQPAPERKKSGNRSDIIQRLIDRTFHTTFLQRNCFLRTLFLSFLSPFVFYLMANVAKGREKRMEEDVSERFSPDGVGGICKGGGCDERMVRVWRNRGSCLPERQ